MTFGVLSDSHRAVEATEAVVERLMEAGATHLVHAGDLELEENLAVLAASGLPYHAVFGNNDRRLWPLTGHYPVFREPFRFSFEGVSVKVMHHPYHIAPMDSDLIIYGHTHSANIVYNGINLVINPGEVCGRETGRMEGALVEVSGERFVVTSLFRYNDAPDWEVKREEFRRDG